MCDDCIAGIFGGGGEHKQLIMLVKPMQRVITFAKRRSHINKFRSTLCSNIYS